MILRHLNILNLKNIREADLEFSDKLNCFVGLNGQGKTNILDAIYILSFTKSAFSVVDSQVITHGESIAMVQGRYADDSVFSYGLKRGQKKQFRCGTKDYKRLIDHIGRIPLVMVCPQDNDLIAEGSEERRRFMDVVISQQDKEYLEQLNSYNALLKQRNALLKQLANDEQPDTSLLEVLEMQMTPLAQYIYQKRSEFIESFSPIFRLVYHQLCDGKEDVTLSYVSQLEDRDLAESYVRTRSRDLILGWTSQGVHKDDLQMLLGEYSLKQVASQGQQKTYLLAMKLAQAKYLFTYGANRGKEIDKPIMLLDDIFDKLDSERVGRIVSLLQSDEFGQIFITDTNRQHLTDIVQPHAEARIFHVRNGQVEI